MRDKKRDIIAIIPALALIVLGAWYVSQPEQRATVRYEQINTDQVTTYPYVASTGRVTFVEQAEPVSGYTATSIAAGDQYVHIDASTQP